MLDHVAAMIARSVEKSTTPPAGKNRLIALENMRDLGWGTESASGNSVNVDSALAVSVVLACARVISEGVAQVPLRVMEDMQDGTKRPALSVPEYKLLHRRPNDWQSSFEFRETLTLHTVLTGNGFAYKNRVNGKLVELIPIQPGAITVNQLPNYENEYIVSDGKGLHRSFTRRDILHLRGPSWDSAVGLNVMNKARNSIGLAMALETSQSKQHANGIKTPGFISFKQEMKDETLRRLRDMWQQTYAGAQNHYKTPMLDNEATWMPMGMSNADAQVIENRSWQIGDICRAFRVFPQMVGFADKTATYASAEQFFLAHVIHGLGPWFSRWEQAIDRDLLEDRPNLYAHFTVTGLLRGDAKTRSQFYSRGILDGWMTRNEARKFEDMNPLPGLDEPLVPLNMGSDTLESSDEDEKKTESKDED